MSLIDSNLEDIAAPAELHPANGGAAAWIGRIHHHLTSLVTASKLSNCPCGFKSAK
jgi:hypothetical protein